MNEDEILCMESFDKNISKRGMFEMLVKFSDAAEKFNLNRNSQDVVKEYLNLSADCRAFLNIFEEMNEISAKDVAILFRAITCLLARIATDLQSYSVLGCNMVGKVMKHCLKAISNFLRDKKKKARVKMSLNLIAAMVVQGQGSAQDVFMKLNLSGSNIKPLFNKSNPEEEDDIRALLLNIIVLLLSVGDNNLVRQIVEEKGFLNSIFPNIASDRASLIEAVLNTLEEKVLKNPNIAKTSKIRLFNDYTVKFVLKLYSWSGPVKPRLLRKRKLGEDIESTSMECSTDDVKLVTKAVDSFLSTLCCSYKYGIIFRDWTFGTSGQNQNHVITNLLMSFQNPQCNLHMSEFVVSVLKICPDQRKYYLLGIKDSFLPRRSDAWFKAISMLKKVIKSGDYLRFLFKYGEKKSVPKLVAVAKAICIPEVMSRSICQQSFMLNQLDVCCSLLDYFHTVLKETEIICLYCKQLGHQALYSQSELKEFGEQFVSSVAEIIPSAELLRAFFLQTLSHQSIQEESLYSGSQLHDSLFSLRKVIDIFALCRQLKVLPISEVDKALLFLLESIRGVAFYFENNEGRSLQLHLFDILSGVDSLKCPSLLQNNATTSPFSLVIDSFMEADDEETTHKAVQVAFSFLKKAVNFDGEKWEVDIWLKMLKNEKSCHRKDLVKFFNDCLYALIVPQPGNPQDSSNMADIGGANTTIDLDVLSKKQMYSSLVSAALLYLNTCTTNFGVCRKYVQSVLSHLFSRQLDLHSLFGDIMKYQELFCKNDLSYWKFLTYFNQETVVENLEEHVVNGGAFTNYLQKSFITFHLHSKKSKKHQMYVYESLKNELDRVEMEEVPYAVWQLLLYIHLEAKKLFDSPKYVTAIPSYTSIIKDLVSNYGDSKLILDSQRSSKLSLLFSDILSHPGIAKCFLPLALFENKNVDYLGSIICAVTTLVFEILSSPMFRPHLKHFNDTLAVLKIIAVQFYGSFSSIATEKSELTKSFCGFFQSAITEFFSFFNDNDIITLLHFLLSVNEELYMELDPQFHVLSLLTKNDCLLSKYPLLLADLVNAMVRKCSQHTLKKRQRKMLRIVIEDLFQRKPTCCLHIKTDCAMVLLELSSDTFLKVITLLIENNQIIQSKFKKRVLRQLSNHISDEVSSKRCLLHTAIQCFKIGKDVTFLYSVSQYLWTYIYTEFIVNSSSDIDFLLEDLPWITAQMMENQILEESVTSETINILICSFPTKVPHPTKVSTIIEILQSLHQCSSLNMIDPSSYLLQLIVVWLERCLTPPQDEVSEFFALVLEFISTCLENINEKIFQKVIKYVEKGQHLIQKCVQIAQSDTTIGGRVLDVASCLMGKLYAAFPHQFPETPESLELFIPNSFNFDTILQNKEGNFSYLSGHVIHFLTTVITAKLNILNRCSSSSILSIYHATLSKLDQKALYVLKMYDEQFSILNKSILWGPAAVSNYATIKDSDKHLLREPKIQILLGLFRQDYLDYTVLNFPLQLSFGLTREGLLNEELPPGINWHKVYDPRFLLNVLCSVLSPGSFVNCRDFIDSSVLPVILVCLSSHDMNIRSQAYYCLTQFYNHLESSTYAPRKLWIAFLNQLRNSLSISNARLPFIITFFLAKSVKLLRQPDGLMYISIYQFLTVKPCLDAGQIPEFYKLFNSCDINYRIQRSWLLSLLADGLRTSLDFHLCQKRYIFTLLLPHFNSAISTKEEKLLIIRILLSIVKIDSSARIMCQFGLIDWLDNLIKSKIQDEMLKGIDEILQALYHSYIATKSCPRSTDQKFQMVKMNLSNHTRRISPCLAHLTMTVEI